MVRTPILASERSICYFTAHCCTSQNQEPGAPSGTPRRCRVRDLGRPWLLVGNWMGSGRAQNGWQRAFTLLPSGGCIVFQCYKLFMASYKS